MPYQGNYASEYDHYGNYVGHRFPGGGQPQQTHIYGQQAGAETRAWPLQQPAFPYAEQQQPPPYRQPQYPQYQQHFQQYNPYQQLPPSHPGQQARSPQGPMTTGLYQQTFQQRPQQPPPASQYHNQFPTTPSSPDVLQHFQPAPQRYQPSVQHPQQQTPRAPQSPPQVSTLDIQRGYPSSKPVPTHTTAPQQAKQPIPYGSEAVQAPQSSVSRRQNEFSVKPSTYQPRPLPPNHLQQTGTEHQRTPSQNKVVQQQVYRSNQQQQPYAAQSEHQPVHANRAPSGYGAVEPSLLQRKVAHVEIPVVKSSTAEDLEMARSPKRRRSNEGDTIEVRHHTPKVNPSVPRPQQSSPLSGFESSQVHSAPALPPSIDNQAALLALSDEYINAAYSMSAAITGTDLSEQQLNNYHDLLASGLGCLEAVLKNYRILDARREAQIRLRFASLLCEETDNNDTAEEVLVKGIAICERGRLTDLKYAMHHVLARVCFGGDKSKAALRNLDNLINEVEKLNLVHWIYAFRFLRVSLALQMGSSQAESAMLSKQLTAISNLAGSHSHVAVQITAHALDALLHLRSQAPGGVDSAQRAIAAARTHQLSPEAKSLPQVMTLLDCMDLSCSLMRFNPEQAAAKLQTMHANLDGQAQSSAWSRDGSFSLPLGSFKNVSDDVETDICGIMKTTANKQVALSFQWLPRSRVYMLGFLLSGLASMYKGTNNDRKAETFFKEGLILTNAPLKGALRSMTAASEEANAQQVMRIVLLLYVAFGYCVRSDWPKSRKAVIAIRKEVGKIDTIPDAMIPTLLTYLEAVSKHGQGDLVGALELYRSQALILPDENSKIVNAGAEALRVLSSLNYLLILRRPDKLGLYGQTIDSSESDRLLLRLEPICTTQLIGNGVEYGNKSLEAAFNILRATSATQTTGQGPIIKTKQHLAAAVHAAKSVADNRLMCVVMNIMTQLFFTSIVGDQAEKSARTSRNLAEKSQDQLWTAVANRMYGAIMERSGKVDEAAFAAATAEKSVQALPATLKAALDLEGHDQPS